MTCDSDTRLRKAPFKTLHARFRNLVVALIALSDAAELVEDGSAQLGHLGAQVDCCQMSQNRTSLTRLPLSMPNPDNCSEAG